MFQWEGSQIERENKELLEQTIVKINDIFARPRLDIRINNSFKVKLTPKDESPVYTQNLPLPINLQKDLRVELALIHCYGTITTLPFPKHASPFLDLNKNLPVSTLSDAAQFLTKEKLFCELEC